MAKLRCIVDKVYERQHNEITLLRTIIISRRAIPTIATLLAPALLAAPVSAAAASHAYGVLVDADLSRIVVTARFAAPTRNISARASNADRYLLAAEDCDSGEALRPRGRRLQLPDDGIRCLKYSIDLGKAAAEDRRNDFLQDSNIVVSPTVWMWRPRLSSKDEIIVRLQMAGDMQVSVPWRSTKDGDNTYRLTASPQSGSAISAFGKFDTFAAHVGDLALPITFLRSSERASPEPIVAWIQDNANNMTLAYGRFPNPFARIVVLPARSERRRQAAVQFGRVVRDGGETVELLIDPSQPIESFYDSWTATHEFAHLMLPYVNRNQRWISEGFAQYYQNILLARSGSYTEQYAWQKLYDGLQRGLASAPTMSPNEAASSAERDTRMKVYWSGAALALMADTELRRRSGGEESLDDVLDRFQLCCLPSARTWSGVELFNKFDTLIDKPLFAELYATYAETAGFPDTSRLLARLGIELQGKKVLLRDDSELAETRTAMTTRRYTGKSGN